MSELPADVAGLVGDIRRYALAKPFVPFEIVVASGERYQITDRFHVAIGGKSVLALVPGRGSTLLPKGKIVAVNALEHSV